MSITSESPAAAVTLEKDELPLAGVLSKENEPPLAAVMLEKDEPLKAVTLREEPLAAVTLDKGEIEEASTLRVRSLDDAEAVPPLEAVDLAAPVRDRPDRVVAVDEFRAREGEHEVRSQLAPCRRAHATGSARAGCDVQDERIHNRPRVEPLVALAHPLVDQ